MEIYHIKAKKKQKPTSLVIGQKGSANGIWQIPAGPPGVPS